MLKKLDKSKINGLILDLRNNGGGSMEEAEIIADIFLNEEIMGIEKYHKEMMIITEHAGQINNKTQVTDLALPHTLLAGCHRCS